MQPRIAGISITVAVDAATKGCCVVAARRPQRTRPLCRPGSSSPTRARLRALTLLLGSILLGLLAPQVKAQAPTGSEPIRVVVVPIRDVVDVVAVRLVNRGVSHARAVGASRVILDIDTPGGAIDAMRKIENAIGLLREGGVRTTAWVGHHALSAGAYLALSCDELFMASSASIGAITPILVGPEGPMQIPDDDVRRKALSAMRGDVRALVERRGGASDDLLRLAEAMVDPTLGRIYEVQIEDPTGLQRSQVLDEAALDELVRRGAKISNPVEIGRAPLTLTAGEALLRGVSGGTYGSLEEMVREEVGAPSSAIERLEPNWSESAVAWLEAIKPLLFIIGFLCLLAEIKMPGFGIPGILGVVLVGLALFSSYLIGLADWTEILLFFLGIGLIGVEVFVMPGTIAFGAVGLVAVVFSLILSQQSFVLPSTASQQEILTGNLLDLLWMILFVVAGSATMFRFLPKLPFFNRALLIPPEGARTGDSTRFARGPEIDHRLLGAVGVAVTDLRPAGVLELPDGSRHDVVSQGAFLARGIRLRVLEAGGNRIVVAPDGEPSPEASNGGERGAASIGFLFLLLIIGLGLVIAEIFLVSAGLLAVGAGVALVTTIFLAFTQHGTGIGFVFLLLTAVGVPAAIAAALRLLPKTSLGRNLLLSGPDPDSVRGAAADAGLAALIGHSGRALSMLRPSGFAEIDGRRVDVVTRGESLESGVHLRVLAVDGNRVVVAEDREAVAT